MRNLIRLSQILILYPVDVFCTIDGLSYMDPLKLRPLPQMDNPCNPLFWYPRELPAFCYQKPLLVAAPLLVPPPILEKSPTHPPPVPVTSKPHKMSLPVAFPVPVPIQPFVPVVPAPLPAPLPLPQSIYPQSPFYPEPVLPGYPGVNPELSYPGFPNQRPGFVPGLPGLVSKDGGINVMPFSDAYAEALNRHTDSLLLKKYRKFLKKISYRHHHHHHRH